MTGQLLLGDGVRQLHLKVGACIYQEGGIGMGEFRISFKFRGVSLRNLSSHFQTLIFVFSTQFRKGPVEKSPHLDLK
jgi:hypothetical protein